MADSGRSARLGAQRLGSSIAVLLMGAWAAGCSGGDDATSSEDVTELLEAESEVLAGEVEFADISDEVAQFYGDLYYDGDMMREGSLGDARVRVIERDEGYTASDVEAMDEAGRFDELPGEHTAWAHEGVLIVVTGDDAVVERLQEALAG